MFKRPFAVKSNTNLRNSDRRKLLATFPAESVAAFHSKATFSVCKAVNFQQREANIFFCDKEPVFFNASDDSNLYPSLYFLWQCPKAIPMLMIHHPVLEFIQNGADLMLQGVHRHDDYKFPEFHVSTPISIGIYNPKNDTISGPIAVGLTLMSSEEMILCGMKGKGVSIHHIIHDYLWEAGSKGNPPKIIQLNTIFESSADPVSETIGDTIDSVLELNDETEPLADVDKKKEKNDDNIQENDESLKKYFFWTLKYNVDPSILPIDAGQFYALYLLRQLPPNVKINLKKTSFKKFSTFLKKVNEFSDGDVLKVESRKGVDLITEINFSHPSIYQSDQLQGGEETASAAKKDIHKPRISECFSVTEAVFPFLSPFGYRKGDIIQQNQVRECVVGYGLKNNLIKNSGKGIALDDNLQVVMRHFIPDTVPLNDVVQKLVSNMTKTVVVTLEDGRKNIKRNQIPSIEFKVEKRSGNKTVTLINNFSFFGIDPKALSKKVQNAMATGASLNQDVPNCEGPQLLVHGNHVNYLGELFQNELGIQKKYIKGLELGVKSKKGKG